MVERVTRYRTADGQEFLTARDAETHEAQFFKLPAQYAKAERVWHVTTEGDVEGRSTRNIGIFSGHLADIAAHLADQACYSLQFEAKEVKPIINTPGVPGKPTATASGVDVTLGIASKTWDLSPAQRAVVFNAAYSNELYHFVQGNSYASAKLKRKT